MPIANTLEGELLRRRLRNDYGAYCAYVNNGYYLTHLHRYLCDEIQGFIEHESDNAMDILLLSLPPRHGKEIAHSTPILTTKGWTTHGQLRVGDQVYAPSGEPTTVRAIIPQVQPCTLLVTISNGETVKVHPHHEWVVYDRSAHRYRTIETADILRNGTVLAGTPGHRGCRYRYLLPLVAPLQNDETPLTVHPYFLGAWLGDGTVGSGVITEGAQDICVLEECARYYCNSSQRVHKTTGVPSWYYSGVVPLLRQIGVLYDKHIPDEYFVASHQQRLQLLAGLLDTDGSLDSSGRYHYSTTRPQLAEDMRSLIATFGWRAGISVTDPVLSTGGVQGRLPVYTVSFTPTTPVPCVVERKRNGEHPLQRRLSITSIIPCTPEEGQCITVDGGVYLIGRTLVPTHNSATVTETLPSWYLGKYPDRNVIICGYEGTFAEGFSRRNRDKFNEYATDIFHVQANDKVQGVAVWETAQGGRCRAAGLKGGITGYGAELFIIDDPIKNRESAESETIIAKIQDEMGPSVQSRIHPGGKLIVIQTRWVENDVIGYVEKNWGEFIYKNINLPCECEDPVNDPLGRHLGDSLIGEHLGDMDVPQRVRNDNKWLRSKKMLVCAGEGEYVWNALYQGHPAPQNGNLFKDEWWQSYSRAELSTSDFEYMCMSVDATFKKTDTSDCVAIEVWGLRQNHVYLWRLINKRMGFIETTERIRRLVKECPGLDELIIEDKANGSAIIDTLRYTDDMPPIVPVNPLGGKYSRAQAVSPFVATRAVHIPNDFSDSEAEEITWDGPEKLSSRMRFILQHSRFPFMKHDDMVDACSQALSRMIKLVTGEEAVPERKYLRFTKWYPDMWEDYEQMSSVEQEQFIRTYGAPLEWEDI